MAMVASLLLRRSPRVLASAPFRRGFCAVTHATSSIWKNHITAPDTPAGFTLRCAFDAEKNPTGAETMLEKWDAGSCEPPHSHPGDDMTVVIEGRMSIQYFTKGADGKLVEDGTPVVLNAGD